MIDPYEALKAAGHSPAKAAEIALDARRGDDHAKRWIAIATAGVQAVAFDEFDEAREAVRSKRLAEAIGPAGQDAIGRNAEAKAIFDVAVRTPLEGDRDLTIADVAERAAPSSRPIRHGFAGRDWPGIDPSDLDPETGDPVEGYSSPCLDDDFHRGEMAVD